jgi:2-oxoisovalerate dehydrogenase E2 component (dihydrolipoyl transacylase)
MTAAAAVPHFHYAEDARVDALVSLRASLAADRAGAAALVGGRSSARGAAAAHHHPPPPRLTYLPFILKALSTALAGHPLVNASLDPSCESVTLHADHNFGIAVDTPAGLAVPVITRVQDRGVEELAAEIARLSSLAVSGALKPGDIAGGTLTVSNIGAVGGGGHAAPLVHVPQAAILAVGR